jgi:hypothetical protein
MVFGVNPFPTTTDDPALMVFGVNLHLADMAVKPGSAHMVVGVNEFATTALNPLR